jgi:predicted metalloprotease
MKFAYFKEDIMSDDKGQKVKDGVKKGASVVGKVVKWVFIAILLIIVAVVGYSCYTCTAVTKAVVDATADSTIVKDAIRDAKGGDDKAKMASEAIAVTAVKLYDAYEANALRADNTYKNKFVRVTGRVSGIDQDITGRPYVKLRSHPTSQYIDFVYVYFKEAETSKIADLDVGQNITIVGSCEGKGILSVNIKDSFFE